MEITRLSRIILATDSWRLLTTGILLLLVPHLFDAPNYDVLSHLIHPSAFALLFIVAGTYCAQATYRQGVSRVRRGFQLSAMMTIVWIATFLASFMQGNDGALRALIPYVSLLVVDFAFVATSVQKKDNVR